MAFRDPVVAYTAMSNTEAHLICDLLLNSGVEAMAMEDVSQVGTGWIGPLAGIHKPLVWVERADMNCAKPILVEYERRNAERRATERGEREGGAPITVTCEECGKPSEFPAVQQGTVQDCPHCRAYVDVGEIAELEGWDDTPAEDEMGPAPDDEHAG